MIPRGLFIVGCLLLPRMALAHIMPEGQASTRLVGNRAYTLVAVPAKSLAAFDDNGDGMISVAELAKHGAAIEASLRTRIRLYADTTPGRVLWQTLTVEHSDTPGAPMPTITLVRISEWDGTVTRLRVESDLLADSRSAQIEFRAILGERTEIDTLSARKSSAEFFAPPVQARLGASDVGLSMVTAAAVALALAVARRRRALTGDPR